MDPRLRGDDERIASTTFYDAICSSTRKKMNTHHGTIFVLGLSEFFVLLYDRDYLPRKGINFYG
jgi:hypothetical protein